VDRPVISTKTEAIAIFPRCDELISLESPFDVAIGSAETETANPPIEKRCWRANPLHLPTPLLTGNLLLERLDSPKLFTTMQALGRV